MPCSFLRVLGAVRWAGFQMGNVGRNAEYIEAGRHSYLNQHNSGDEWLTGFAGDAMRSIYGELLRPNFSVKCVIYGHPYYLRSCPVHDTLRPIRVPRYYISENYFEPRRKKIHQPVVYTYVRP